MTVGAALANLPEGLRKPLIDEYQQIVKNYAEHRWSPAELSGGRFCEIVYTIIDGHGQGTFPAHPSKPKDFVAACRKLEQNKGVPRSFQILIPRLLPALYEVRNNRGVGHVGGDVDPNHMDATFALTSCNWIMAELVRVFHALSTVEATKVAASLVERRIPLIWEDGNIRRVLDPKMKLKPQVLVLLATSTGAVRTLDLLDWTGYRNATYFRKLLRQMHAERLLELSKDEQSLQILPPGSEAAANLVR